MGEALAEEVKRVLASKNVTIDVVIPVRALVIQCVLFLLSTGYVGPRYQSCSRARTRSAIRHPVS